MGIKLKLQLITLDDIKKHPKFIEKIDNWLLFDHNKDYYICVNSNPNEYHIPTRSLSQEQFDIEEDPVYYYLSKSDIKPVSWLGKIPIREHHKNVINYLKNNKG